MKYFYFKIFENKQANTWYFMQDNIFSKETIFAKISVLIRLAQCISLVNCNKS